MPIAARNGARPRDVTRHHGEHDTGTQSHPGSGRVGRARAENHHAGGREQHQRRQHPHPSLTEPVRQAVDTRARVVRKVRQHVQQVGSDAEECAGEEGPQRRQLRVREGQGHDGGQGAEGDGIGDGGPHGPLEVEVVGPARRDTQEEVYGGSSQAAGQREHHAEEQRDGHRASYEIGADLPSRDGLVRAPHLAVPGRVDQVVGPADAQLTRAHGGGDEEAAAEVVAGGDREQRGQRGDREGGRWMAGLEQHHRLRGQGSGHQPVATGRSGSATHSLHEPG